MTDPTLIEPCCPCCGDPLAEDEETDPESGLCPRCVGEGEP